MVEKDTFHRQLHQEIQQVVAGVEAANRAPMHSMSEERARLVTADEAQREATDSAARIAIQAKIVSRIKEDVGSFAELMREAQILPTTSLQIGLNKFERRQVGFFERRHTEKLGHVLGWVLPFTIQHAEESSPECRRRVGSGMDDLEVLVTHSGMAIDVDGTLLNFKDRQHGIWTSPRSYGIRKGPGFSNLYTPRTYRPDLALTSPLFRLGEASTGDIVPIAEVTPILEVIEGHSRVEDFRSALVNLARESHTTD